MTYRIRLTTTASDAVSELSEMDRAEFDRILTHLADFPFPLKGSTVTRRVHIYGRDGYTYSHHSFPCVIHYSIDEGPFNEQPDFVGWLTIVFLVAR